MGDSDDTMPQLSTSTTEQHEIDEHVASDSDDSYEEENHTENQASKFDLAKIFLKQDSTSTYFAEGRFDEAFGVLDQRKRMGREMRNARSILNYGACLMSTGHDYNAVKEPLKSVIATVKPTSKSVLWLVKKLRKQNEWFSALLIDEICADYYFDADRSYETFGIIENFIASMRQTLTALVERDENMEMFAQHILPKIYNLKQKLLQLQNIDPYYHCVKSAYLTHCIEVCEPNTGARIKLILDTVNYMQETIGDEEANKHQMYGTICSNLATTYLKMGLRNDAQNFFEKALECFQSATDFQDETKKMKYINDAMMSIRRAQGLEPEVGIGFGRN